MKIPTARRVRTGAVLAAASAAVLAAGGCQSGGAAQHSAGPKAASAPAAPAGANVLKGSTLKSLLLPAGAMPKGFRLIPDITRDTGDDGSGASTPIPAAEICDALGQTSWIRVAGIASATFAQNGYGNAAQTDEIAQEIDTFRGDDAQRVMAKLRKVFAHCATFTDKSASPVAKIKLKTATVHGAGDQAMKAVETSPTWQGGTTLAAVRVGNAIVTMLVSSSHADKGAAAVTLAERVAKKVKAAG
ncbi:MAG: hypothetical protein ACJ72W_28675 [Actinoallomurus sp.]